MTNQEAIGYACMAARYMGMKAEDTKLFFIILQHFIEYKSRQRAEILFRKIDEDIGGND